MRVGLYGPMANSGYTLARGLRAAGYDAEYIHEPEDRYPMSQPLWEEVELTIDPSGLPYDVPTAEEWEELARANSWRRPAWVVEAPPATASDLGLRQRVRAARVLAAAPRSRWELRQHLEAHAARIAAFGTYDWLVVCGVRLVDAFLSGTPYTFWPNGGDLSIVPFRNGTPHERFEAAAMRVAIRAGAICGTHDPVLADHFGAVGRRDVPFLPFLVDTNRYAPCPPERRGPLAREVERRAAGRKTLLLAARQDVRWKGTDRFARAFVRAVREGADLFLVVTPWGDDMPTISAILGDAPKDAVHTLSGVTSKPVLVDLYSVADVVVDQFTLGVHGSTMLEALACATPVLIRLDLERFRARWPSWTPPPLLDATSEQEILDALRSIAAGAVDLEALGRAGREWVKDVHGAGQAYRFVPRAIRSARAAPGSDSSATPASPGSTLGRP